MTLTTERPTIYVRDDNTPTVSPCRGLSRSLVGRAFLLIAQAAGFAAFMALLAFWVVVADALINTPEPETREFNAADQTHSYRREQRQWSIE